ncbi:hypothetical protein [Actinopolymorpha alba]|uniref:hypothetical protein n=1 Tax=Actinopolymorpha alba TaxID=533267 RepID=UPI0003A31357|nr:hypothetical protein [Actinopolymorpha alba]
MSTRTADIFAGRAAQPPPGVRRTAYGVRRRPSPKGDDHPRGRVGRAVAVSR